MCAQGKDKKNKVKGFVPIKWNFLIIRSFNFFLSLSSVRAAFWLKYCKTVFFLFHLSKVYKVLKNVKWIVVTTRNKKCKQINEYGMGLKVEKKTKEKLLQFLIFNSLIVCWKKSWMIQSELFTNFWLDSAYFTEIGPIFFVKGVKSVKFVRIVTPFCGFLKKKCSNQRNF